MREHLTTATLHEYEVVPGRIKQDSIAYFNHITVLKSLTVQNIAKGRAYSAVLRT